MSTTTPTRVSEDEVRELVAQIQAATTAYYEENYPTLTVPEIIYTVGPRYARIMRRDHPTHKGGSAHTFVDMTTGDILKPASFKAPARGSRGNIRGDRTRALNPHGAR